MEEKEVHADAGGHGWEAIVAAQQGLLERCLPLPQLPGLRNRVHVPAHIREINSLLGDVGMLVDSNLARGHEGRCRAAIATSFSAHPELSSQFISWCSQGLLWTFALAGLHSNIVKVMVQLLPMMVSRGLDIGSTIVPQSTVTMKRNLENSSIPHTIKDYSQIVVTL